MIGHCLCARPLGGGLDRGTGARGLLWAVCRIGLVFINTVLAGGCVYWSAQVRRVAFTKYSNGNVSRQCWYFYTSVTPNSLTLGVKDSSDLDNVGRRPKLKSKECYTFYIKGWRYFSELIQ